MTKLHRPAVTGHFVARPRLVEQLNRGLSGPLNLVCAPAGFGKTTLVSAWIAEMTAGGRTPPLPVAWLSLDEADSDPVLFLSYFIAALRTIFPAACPATLDLLCAPVPPASDLILATFINELALLPTRFVLVLDDYHAIDEAAVHSLIVGLVRHGPASMHLVIISRNTPSLPLANLRAKGQVVEIRGRDLRFTPEEAGAFLGATLPIPPSPATVTLLEQRTEGWIAGLHLAALSLAAADDVQSAELTLANVDADIADFLVDEVLLRQSPQIQEFLLLTSVLDRFCAPLCETIVGHAAPQCDVRTCLDWLERANLFVVPLDNSREWYRYHHLFRNLLKLRLLAQARPAQVAELHRLAALWFAGRDLIDEALRHALAADDLDLAAHLMEQGLRDALNREDRPTLERWLHLLPDEFIRQRPELLMIRAWALEFTWQLGAQWQILGRVEALIADDRQTTASTDELRIVRGQLLTLHGQAAYLRNEGEHAAAFCREALAVLPSSWTYVRGGAMLYLGLGMQANGQGRTAERLLLDEYAAHGGETSSYAPRLLMILCFIFYQEAQLEQAGRTAQLLLQATQQGSAILRCWAHYFLGAVYYQRNELAAARQHFDAVIQRRHSVLAVAAAASFFGLALTQQACGETAEAGRTLDLLSEFDLQSRGAEAESTRSLRARLMLLQGNLEDAARWADAFISLPPDRPLLWLEEPHFTKARILLARDGDGDVAAALQILDDVHEIARRTFNLRVQIEVLALRALAFDLQGQTGDALNVLRQAVELAQPGGFIRVFADLGPRMRAMLLRLSGQGFAVETIRRILAAVPVAQAEIKTHEAEFKMRAANAELIESLTGRELEVLALLRERLSNKEIALKLSLSTATVKRHTVNLFGKLGVNRRWDAVTKAESLGILSPR